MSEAFAYDEETYAPEAADGVLVILVCRAKHLPNRRKLDKQSPYVTLRIGTTAKKTHSHFRAGQTPEWSHEIRFQLTRERKPIMKIDVLDETKHDPTPIGAAEIDCSAVFNPENRKVESDPLGKQTEKYIYDKWYDLTLHDRRAGIIYLEMTFYPQAPVVPPKVSLNPDGEYQSYTPQLSPQASFYAQQQRSPLRNSNGSSNSIKNLPPPPRHPSQSRGKTAADDVFVSGEESAHPHLDRARQLSAMFKNNANGHEHIKLPAPAAPENNGVDAKLQEEVFVDNGSPKLKRFGKLNKLKERFQTREPLTNLWSANNSPLTSPKKGQVKDGESAEPRSRSISPLSEYGRDNHYGQPHIQDQDDFSQLERDVHGRSPYYADRIDNDDLDYSPPIPPPHTVSITPPPPVPSDHYKKKSPLRKPPPTMSEQLHSLSLSGGPLPSTSIPFSANDIGGDDDDDDFFDDDFNNTLPPPPPPQKRQDIDPKFYAPVPTENFNKISRLQSGKVKPDDVRVDYRTKETGYLGEGKWNENKFSPSIFDKMPMNDENHGFENKPHVPPKIPQGLTEMEYYVLEQEKYLKDINGNRM